MSPTSIRPVILLAFANDRDDSVNYLRNLPEEARQIREPIQRARRDGLCDLVELANATAEDIFRVFQDPEYRDRIAIFHYGGHANGYQLLLESADGSPAAADAGGLAAFLGQQKALQLAFLNGCSTQQQVTGLLDASISAVIATSRAIDDQVAMQFARQFYQGLAGGATLRKAYTEAEASVQTTSGGKTRGLYFGKSKQKEQHEAQTDRWPWELYLREGAEIVADWSLPGAVGDPLFGLPDLPKRDLPESPFRHLDWFDRKQAEVFFGRGHQIRQLYDLITSPGTAPIVLFYGQSGVGKSSMLAAGLIPRLEQDYKVRYLRRDQERGLLDTLRSTFVAAGTSVSVTDSMHFAQDWLEVEDRTGKPLVIILDQVEEVITHPNPELPHETEDFLIELEAMFGKRQERPAGRLILSFRKEWLAEVEARLSERHLSRTKVFLERLGRLGVIDIVMGPTRTERLRNQYGLTVEDGLAEIIADDLLADAESAIAPTLQILLTKMWSKAIEKNLEQPHFSQELYQSLKREGLLLRDFLDQQLAQFRRDNPKAVDSGLVLDLLALHTTALGTAGQCARDQIEPAYSGLGHDVHDLLQQSEDLHLLSKVVEPGQIKSHATRLSHDTLAPLVRERFDNADEPGQRARRILLNRAVEWKDGNEGHPLDAADLAIVEAGRSGMRKWTADEERLVAASRKQRALRTRIKRTLAIATVAAVACILFFGILAFQESRIAQNNTVTAHFLVAGTASEQGRPAAALHWFWRGYSGANSRDTRKLNARNLIASWSRSLGTQLRHNNTVTAVAFSPDSQLVMTGSQDGTARLWESDNGNPQNEPMVHKLAIRTVAFSPDGLMMITGSDDRTAQRWYVESGKPRGKPLQHESPVIAAAFAQNEETVVTGCEDGSVRRWHSATGELLGDPVQLPETATKILGFNAKADRLLLQTKEKNNAQVWDSVNGKTICELIGHEAMVNAAVFSADGTQVLTGSNDKQARLWNANSGEQIGEPFQYDTTIVSVGFHPDASMIVTGSDDNTARLWSVESRLLVGEPMRHEGTIAGVAFSPDSKLIITASWDNSARLWDTSNPRYWDATTGEARGKPLPHKDAVMATAFSPDGQTAITGSADKTAKLWSISSRHQIGESMTHSGTIVAVDVSPDGKTLLTASADKTARFWNSDSGSARGEPLVHDGPLTSAKFSPDGTIVVTGSEDKTARLWKVPSAKPQGNLLQHDGTVLAVAFSPDGSLVITGSDDARARIWDVATGTQKASLQHLEAVNSVAFSPDGQTVVTGSDDNSGRLWDVATGEQKGAILQHNEPVSSVLFTADGEFALTGSDDNTVRMWEVEDGEPHGEPLRHDGPVKSVAVSPDGHTIVTGSDDTTAQLWDAATGQPRGEPLRHQNMVVSVAFSPDGHTVITGSLDNTARFWNVPPPAENDAERLRLSVEVRSGYYRDSRGIQRILNQEQWLKRREELESIGGPCCVRRWEDM